MNNIIQSMSGVNGIGAVNDKVELTSLGSATTGSVIPINGPGFGEVMADIASSTVNNMKQAEQVSIEAVKGNANTREVVDALMTAERSLQTAIAIRDKIVTAYLDVTRMQI